MALKIPSTDELQQRAKANFFELNPAELARLQAHLTPLLSVLELIPKPFILCRAGEKFGFRRKV
jgi:hypothetical protein